MQKPSDGPTLDDVEDFALSPTFERPKFESIEIPRPDENEEDRLQTFSTRPIATTPATTTTTAAPQADAGMVDVFSLHGAPPASPPDSRPQPQPTSPSPSPPTTAPLSARDVVAGVKSLFPPASNPSDRPARIRTHIESYGDELWSAQQDTGRPAFERSPFVVGVVEFLFYPGTLVRWLTLTSLATVPIAVLELTAANVGEFGSLLSLSSSALLMFAGLFGIPWLVVFGAHAMSIVADTGRGLDAIENWPLGGFIPRGNPLYLPIAVAAGMLPGLVVFGLYYLSREAASIRGPMMLLVSAMLFTPLVWLPMLLEKSLPAPLYSQTFWQSFRYSGNGWIVFYFETLLLCLLAAAGVSLWSYGSVILAPLSALLLVTPLFLYFRLVGRLLWFIDPDMAPPPPMDKAGPAPLPDTVDPTQFRR